MNWKIFFLKFFRNLVLALILSVALMGGFGYLLAGREGMINMAYWGIALGLIGGFASGIGVLFEAKYWGDGNFPILPEWNWFVNKSDDEEKKTDY